MKTPPIHLHISVSVGPADQNPPAFEAKLHQGEATIVCREPAAEPRRSLTDLEKLRRNARGL